MEPLTYALEGNVAIVTMDDGKANALSDTMIDALLEALDRAEKEASAMILVGRKDKFCAGFDLKVMMSGPEHATALLTRGSALFMRLYSAKLPLIMVCTGHALAGGALVLLTGDVRIGTLGPYRIGLNEVSIGMPIPILAMELARDRLSTLELGPATLEARIYSPEDAVKAGYLDIAVSEDTLLARAKTEAARLTALGRNAFVGTKKRLRSKTIKYIEDTLPLDMATFLSDATK